jgi:hypothetical protein
MAQYRAVISTPRGQVSRLGHKTTGMRIELNGWGVGVKVVARFDEKTQEDVFDIFKTSGSSYRPTTELIATVRR